MSDGIPNPWDPVPSDDENPCNSLESKSDSFFFPDVGTVVTELLDFLRMHVTSFLDGRCSLSDVEHAGRQFITEKSTQWAREASQVLHIESLLVGQLPDLVSDCLEKAYWAVCRDILVQAGFSDFVVDSRVVQDLLSLRKEFDLDKPPPRPESMTGSDLCVRWGLGPKEIVGHVKYLPVFLFSRASREWTCITHQIPWPHEVVRYQEDPENSQWFGEKPLNLWFCLALWWKLDVKHVEFYEKLPLTRDIKREFATRKWLTFDELVARWKVTPYKVEQSIRDRGLTAHHLDSKKDIVESDDDFLSFPSQLGQPMKTMCLYDVHDVRIFERNKKVPGLNDRSLDRIQIEELVRPWVSKNPELRTGDAVKMLRATHLFDHLSRDETLAEKVRPFIKNRTPGPRKKP